MKKKNWTIRTLSRSEKSAQVVKELVADPVKGDLSSINVMMSKNQSAINLNETMDYRDDICGVYSICKKEAEVLAIEANKNIDS